MIAPAIIAKKNHRIDKYCIPATPPPPKAAGIVV